MASAAGQVIVARCLALDAVAAEVVSALRGAGIDSVLLKGPVTVHWLYADDPGQRLYSDVDLLVAPDRFDAACDIARSLGFRSQRPGLRASEAARLYELAWLRDDGERIEIHRSFGGVGDPSAFWKAMREHTMSLRVVDAEVAAPDAAAAALIYALHAAQHGVARELSAKPLEDLRRALVRFDDDVWAAAATLARRVGASSAFTVGLRLDAAGAELALRLDVPHAAPPTAWLRAESRAHGARYLEMFAAAPTWRSRCRFVFDAVLPSRGKLRERRPWADRGPLWLLLAHADRLRRAAYVVFATAWDWPHARTSAKRSGWEPTRRGERRVQRGLRYVRAAARFARHPDRHRALAAWWTLRAHHQARRQLADNRNPVRLAPLPGRFAGDAAAVLARRSTVRTVLRLRGATCLESATVRQTWLAAAGDRRDIVIGVTAPAAGFRAHAWLDGEPAHGGFTELTRRPAPRPRLPDFVIIGAAKAGSTSLWAYLRAHPQVFLPAQKEPEFFLDGPAAERGLDWYRGLFEHAADARAVGEASVRYTSCAPRAAGVAQRMASVLPDAKLIYVVRHPVHRMVSQWQHNRSIYAEPLPIERALRTARYVEASRYAKRLAPFLAHYPPERVLVVISERLRTERRAVLREVCEFVGVDPDVEIDGLDREWNRSAGKRVPREWMQLAMRVRAMRRLRRAVLTHVPPRAVRALDLVTREAAPAVVCPPLLEAELADLFADDIRALRPYVREPFDGWGIA